ncbi:MAG TPA: LacI family DNA-binding transcriptional regulator [Acidimicrobiia bacterium]|nr:LacI family DNA-binding transcriptional regulator [Acidimicrobiia bacterium]
MESRRRQATIEDVAARSGVSVATVSRTLRGLPNVSATTRQRVIEAAAALQYRPDPHASRLAAGKTQTIGIGVPLIHTWYYAQILSGVESVLAEQGYDLLVVTVAGAEQRASFVAKASSHRKRVDGMIMVDLFFDPSQVDEMAESGMLAVTVGVHTDRFDSITIDNQASARLATGHLLNLGHRRIGLISGVVESTMMFTASIDRRAGYIQALASAGVDYDPALQADGGDSIDGAEEAMSSLLAVREPPTAVFALSDEMAMGAMKAIRSHGMKVPDDISVVGFDDHDLAAVLGLTTVRQQVVKMAAAATRLLLARFAEPEAPPQHQVTETRLIVRTSTAPPKIMARIS